MESGLSTNKSRIVLILLFLFASVITFFALTFFPLPFLWVLLCWSGFFFFMTTRAKLTYSKAIWFNITSILLLFALFELIFFIIELREKRKQSAIRVERVYEVEKDDIVGSRLIKNTSRHARKFINNKLLYDVVITTDSDGLRISPACNGKCDSSVLFFGDSFTFGEGVNDSETMPFLVGLGLKDKYRVYNFGVHGYGPHQMLSAIEHGMVNSIVKNEVRYVIYQSVYPEHIRRALGFRSWDQHGPMYKLGNDMQAYYAGHFDDHLRNKSGLWQKSSIYRKIMSYTPRIHKTDQYLFIAIICKSKQLLVKKYPKAEFHMIVWDWTEGRDKWVFDELQRKGIYIHNINDILPDKNKLNLVYKISEADKHPNAFAQKIIAQYILNHVIGK